MRDDFESPTETSLPKFELTSIKANSSSVVQEQFVRNVHKEVLQQLMNYLIIPLYSKRH